MLKAARQRIVTRVRKTPTELYEALLRAVANISDACYCTWFEQRDAAEFADSGTLDHKGNMLDGIHGVYACFDSRPRSLFRLDGKVYIGRQEFHRVKA